MAAPFVGAFAAVAHQSYKTTRSCRLNFQQLLPVGRPRTTLEIGLVYRCKRANEIRTCDAASANQCSHDHQQTKHANRRAIDADIERFDAE